MRSNIGTPKTINFPFVPNGKLIVLGFPILYNTRIGFWDCYGKNDLRSDSVTVID